MPADRAVVLDTFSNIIALQAPYSCSQKLKRSLQFQVVIFEANFSRFGHFSTEYGNVPARVRPDLDVCGRDQDQSSI